MSKYVRTDEGILYVGDLIKDEYGNYCYKETYETDMEVNGEYIIDEADTVEELCDEIVVKENSSSKPKLLSKLVDFDENGNKFYVKGEYSFKGIAYTLKELINKYKEMSVKGAIWSDVGLIYVGDMDKEGKIILRQ